MQDIIKADNFCSTFFQGPKLASKPAWGRLQKGGNGQMIGPEPDAERAQCGALVLIQRLHVVGHFGAVEDAKVFCKLEGDATGNAGKGFGSFQFQKRPKQFFNVSLKPKINAGLNQFARRRIKMLVGENAKPRLQCLFAR